MASDNKNNSSQTSRSDGGWFAKGGRAQGKWLRLTSVLLLFSITILLLVIAGSIYFGSKSEGSYVNSNVFQAVNVSGQNTSSGNQTYYGHIKSIANSYFVLEDVYYTQTTQAGNKLNTTLQPLVCQPGQPFGQLIINRNNVNWWNNLQSSSSLVTAINNFESNSSNQGVCTPVLTLSSLPVASSTNQ